MIFVISVPNSEFEKKMVQGELKLAIRLLLRLYL